MPITRRCVADVPLNAAPVARMGGQGHRASHRRRILRLIAKPPNPPCRPKTRPPCTGARNRAALPAEAAAIGVANAAVIRPTTSRTLEKDRDCLVRRRDTLRAGRLSARTIDIFCSKSSSPLSRTFSPPDSAASSAASGEDDKSPRLRRCALVLRLFVLVPLLRKVKL